MFKICTILNGKKYWAVGLGLDWFPGSEIGSEKIRAQVFIMASGSCNGYKIIIFLRLGGLPQWSVHSGAASTAVTTFRCVWFIQLFLSTDGF